MRSQLSVRQKHFSCLRDRFHCLMSFCARCMCSVYSRPIVPTGVRAGVWARLFASCAFVPVRVCVQVRVCVCVCVRLYHAGGRACRCVCVCFQLVAVVHHVGDSDVTGHFVSVCTFHVDSGMAQVTLAMR